MWGIWSSFKDLVENYEDEIRDLNRRINRFDKWKKEKFGRWDEKICKRKWINLKGEEEREVMSHPHISSHNIQWNLWKYYTDFIDFCFLVHGP